MTTWNERKRRLNLAKHRVDLALAQQFDLDTAQIDEDRDVGHETRFRATSFIGDRMFFMVFTLSTRRAIRM